MARSLTSCMRSRSSSRGFPATSAEYRSAKRCHPCTNSSDTSAPTALRWAKPKPALSEACPMGAELHQLVVRAAVRAGTYPDASCGLRLYYLLPNFGTSSDRNRAEFVKPGWHQTIMISLTYPNQLGDLHEVMYGPRGFLSASSPEVTSSLDDYREFRWLGRHIIYISRSDPNFYFQCSDEPGHTRAGLPGEAWWPSCSRRFSWQGLAVYYAFSVEFMTISHEIDARVHQILDGMLVERQHPTD